MSNDYKMLINDKSIDLLKLFKLFFVLFSYVFLILVLQNFTPLKEMQLEGRACFLSSTKAIGTRRALHLTLQGIVNGVQLKQNMIMNSGVIAQLTVSTQ